MCGAWFRLLCGMGWIGMAVVTASESHAQSKKAPAKFALPGSADSVSMGSKEGSGGARRAPARPRPGAAVATFPGFRLLPDGSSRIYVELTRQVTVDEKRAAQGTLVYVIHDARVPVRNNRNALITTHFATPVGRARLLSSGPDVELVIDLRKTVSATQKVVAGENGGVRLEIDFPAGDYPPAPGLFEPQAGRSRDVEEPETGETPSVPNAAAPSAAPGNGRPTSPPADAARAAPSASSPSTPTQR